jgi:hypothetical protein
LIKPRKADYESKECKRVLNGKYSSAKEKDLRTIPDWISGTMRRIYLEHLRELGGTQGAIK